MGVKLQSDNILSTVFTTSSNPACVERMWLMAIRRPIVTVLFLCVLNFRNVYKTKRMCECSTFLSYLILIYRTYSVVSPNLHMDCDIKNVIYLIKCKRYGIQYVSKTGKKLRQRLNNHRNIWT